MTTKPDIDIAALFDQGDAVLEAVRLAGIDAMKQYILAGESMVSWKDGKVVHIPPEELKKMLAEAGEE